MNPIWHRNPEKEGMEERNSEIKDPRLIKVAVELQVLARGR